MVRRPMTLALRDLLLRPKRSVTSVHECAGDPLKPTRAFRAVATLVWSGADLREVLDEAGIDRAAQFVWSYGVDHGEYEGTRNESYLKDLPLERAMAGDVLLAYEMNGVPLTVEHGAPIRLFIPGFYGTNCVKWLCRITVADRRPGNPMTTVLYNDGPDGSQPVWEIAPESVIVSPAPDIELPVGKPAEVWGWAWAASGVTQVEVSIDGGTTYERAKLGDRTQWSWQRFSHRWTPGLAGRVTISSRATDCRGTAQPSAGARNSIHTVAVKVIASRES